MIYLTFDGEVITSIGGAYITDPTEEHVAAWSFEIGEYSAPESSTVTVTKPDGTAQDYSAPISTKSVTIPAGILQVGENTVSVTVTFEDGTSDSDSDSVTVLAMYVSSVSPQSGYVRNESEAIFTWAFIRRIAQYNNPAVPYSAVLRSVETSGGTFQWRNGESGTVNSIAITDSGSITVPAGTFPDTASLQWRLVGIGSAAGDSVTTDWYTVTTLESSCSAACVSPVDTVTDGSAEIEFKWSHIIDTGTAPTGYTLQTSADGSTWTTLSENLDTDATSYTAPAGTFSAGVLYWRVKTYNSDGSGGDWSDAAELTIVAAPATPSISVVSMAPRFSIRWTNSGQQSYELRLDGEVYTYVFGTDGNYTYDRYLSDGSHEVAVRIQNGLGLWSDWATAALQINNSPGTGIALLVSELDTRVKLAWSSTGSYTEFWVYRNGERIARTVAAEFTDNYAAGSCEYYIVGVLPDGGNYTKSNTESLTAPLSCLNITDTETGVSLNLELSETQIKNTSLSRSLDAEFTFYAGQALPEAELGESVELAYSLSCAFKSSDTASCAAIEAMFGHVVCLRDEGGTRIFAPLVSLKKTRNLFYVVYSASLQAVAFDEEAANG